MAKPADVNGWGGTIIELDATSEEDGNRWPGRQNAPSIVGVDRRRFRELIAQGRLQEYRVYDGSIRYDPKQLRALSDEFALEEQTSDPSFAVAGVQIEGMKTANDVLKLQMEFNKSFMQMFLQSQESVTKSQNATIEHLTKALEWYQRERLTHIKEQGETKIQELVLGLEAQDKEVVEARRTMVIQAIAPHIGPVLSAITESVRTGLGFPKATPSIARPEPATTEAPAPDHLDSIGGEPPVPVVKTELGAMAEGLLRSVGPDKLRALQMAGVLDDEDSEVLGVIVAQIESAESNPPTESK
jgi:hypothetical protein